MDIQYRVKRIDGEWKWMRLTRGAALRLVRLG
jgi:hypothetical protein